MKEVILLNGPSSSGKSTLASMLQLALDEQRGEKYAIVSIDDFMKLSTNETIYEDDVFEISGDMCREAIQALSNHSGAIIDHVITSHRIFDQMKQLLGGFKFLRVHVDCPLEVLLRREQARGDRCLGSAEASHTYLFPKEGYDLSVNTHTMTVQACVQQILKYI